MCFDFIPIFCKLFLGCNPSTSTCNAERDNDEHIAAMSDFISNYLSETDYIPDVSIEQLPMDFTETTQPTEPTSTPTNGWVNFHLLQEINVVAQVTFLTSMCFDVLPILCKLISLGCSPSASAATCYYNALQPIEQPSAPINGKFTCNF